MQNIPIEKELEIYKILEKAKCLPKEEVIELLSVTLFLFARTELAYQDIIKNNMFSEFQSTKG